MANTNNPEKKDTNEDIEKEPFKGEDTSQSVISGSDLPYRIPTINNTVYNNLSLGKEKTETITFNYYKKSNYIPPFKFEEIESTISSLQNDQIFAITGDNYNLIKLYLESFLFEKENKNYNQIFYCELENNNDYKLNTILENFKENELHSEFHHQYLIIKDKNKNLNKIQEFLYSIGDNYTIHDSVQSKFKNDKISVVYVFDEVGYESTVFTSKYPFEVLSIDYKEQALLSIFSNNKEQAAAVLQKLNQTDLWNNHRRPRENYEKILQLYTKGELETVIENEISKIQSGDDSIQLSELLNDPLKNVVLFVAAFFSKININEFDQLVQIIFTQQYQPNKNIERNPRYDLTTWEYEQDIIISECELAAVEDSDTGVLYFYFSSDTRIKIIQNIFFEKYKLTTNKRFDILKREVLFASDILKFSTTANYRVLNLCLVSSQTDNYNFFTKTALHLLAMIEEAYTSKNGLTYNFSFEKLIILISFWIHKIKDSLFLDLKYNDDAINPVFSLLNDTTFGRIVLQRLLRTLDISTLENNSAKKIRGFFKIFLEKLPLTEIDIYFGLETTEVLAERHGMKIDHFIETINNWEEKKEKNFLNQSVSFAYAKGSFLKYFYDRIFNDKDERLSGVLVKFLFFSKNSENIKTVISFFFNSNNYAAIYITFYKGREEYESLSGEELMHILTNTINLTYAFIVVDWYHMLLKENSTKGTNKKFKKILAELGKRDLIVEALFKGLSKAIGVFNNEIRAAKNDKKRKAKMMTRRNYVRNIIALLKENYSI